EGVTAAAFTLFAKNPADVLLLEVGLGGRLDATNVVSQPMLTAITPISEDHKEYLGDNLAAIAAEKAGILKPGVPCVVGPQASESMTVLEEKADAVHAPLFRFGKEWFLEQGPNGYAYVSERHHLPFSAPGLQGPHQWQNAATAIACMDVLADAGKAPCAMADEALGQGIVGATWPGRLQALPIGNLPHGSELWLDGGHNPAAGQVLTHWAEERWGETPELHLICGMLKDKDAKAFLTPLAGKVKRFWAVPIPDEPNSHPPHALAELASSLGMKAMAAPSVPAVLQAIATHENTVPQRVLIAGSLYLAGAVLAQYSQSL
ncbi:MAG: bifunctional folylpolyglutamate synthase/dihydrofolate synthase, partial [Rickettsiales bacterium]